MKFTRREFVKTTAAGTAAMLLYKGQILRSAYAYGYSPGLQKFIQPMPLFGAGIPLAQPHSNQPFMGVDYYKITAGVYRQQLHPALPNPTTLYGYKSSGTAYSHLGGAIIAQRGRPVRISIESQLPASHILPYDTTVANGGNDGARQDKIALHLHGGRVPWPSDGGPFHWQTNSANGGLKVGASVIPWLWDGVNHMNPNLVFDYFYPNDESARFMWYHDHGIAQTRLNAYAGLATGYIVVDPAFEASLNLPWGEPIVFQDKVFYDPAMDGNYYGSQFGAAKGDLWYPYLYEGIWDLANGGEAPLPSCVPEMFGDTMLANGVVFPFHNVDSGIFKRFRLLNACNGRFLDLSFAKEAGDSGEVQVLEDDPNKPVLANVDVSVIGTEGGYLNRPVQIVREGAKLRPFIMGPAERYDILVKFNEPGSNVILYNVGGSPYPGGEPIFDWYVGNSELPQELAPGYGPNTRTIMRFQVGSTASANAALVSVPATIPVSYIPTVPDPADPFGKAEMVDPTSIKGSNYSDPLTNKKYKYFPMPDELTLNEGVETSEYNGQAIYWGRLLPLIGRLGTDPNTQSPAGPEGIYYHEAPTEFVTYDSLRIWKVYNLTGDAHPMHFHLFNVQVLARQSLVFYGDAPAYPPAVNINTSPSLGELGYSSGPEESERGFKETVIMYPGEVTTLAVLVDNPLPTGGGMYTIDKVTGRPQVKVTNAAGKKVQCPLPFSPRLQGYIVNGIAIQGDEYVWHCHILEHEEHDMMRPLVAS